MIQVTIAPSGRPVCRHQRSGRGGCSQHPRGPGPTCEEVDPMSTVPVHRPRVNPVMVREYGCVLCDRAGAHPYHREGIDALYEPHHYFQSKGGTYLRPATAGELFLLAMRE